MKAKQFLLVICAVFLVSVIGLMIWFYNTTITKQLNDYTKEKYGEKIVLVEEGASHTGNMGDTVHKVALKSDPSIEFNIEVDGDLFERLFTVVRDDLEYMITVNKEFPKLTPYVGEIESLEFIIPRTPTFDLFSEVMEDDPHLFIVMDEYDFNADIFEKQTLHRYYQLIKLLNKADTSYQDLRIHLFVDRPQSFHIANIKSITSSEQIAQMIYEQSPEIKNLLAK
ncbi:hypothetical protein [Mangrovibacillus cuniculi]|uniref:Uncharacterized protein n=1 Tax=Mangrovibacillus cuniculi TaxID=2593652 RepID=A0A7S8CCR2_9BACI|nr:hypothetical protein [Mangrovibacillus cuniculi]QPC47594.1 hypothetical protein G8O30_11840 [Mangrovibacillus cuniculi]